MFKKTVSIIVLILFIFTLTGCAAFDRYQSRRRDTRTRVSDDPYSPEVSAALRFRDIPVPVELSIIPEDSYSFQTETFRAGLLKYQGRMDPEILVNFFKEQMPRHNWELVNIIEYDRKLLNFEKQNQSCVITIETRRATSYVTISVAPKSDRSAPLGTTIRK